MHIGPLSFPITNLDMEIVFIIFLNGKLCEKKIFFLFLKLLRIFLKNFLFLGEKFI